ncbi:hypothetical protein BDW74DRAFT_172311 [Aspergillus multicolor]|uniref:uncharacterized protein n=1 Tax=Aspergillus multicolor TaxID=41759 RepID=UPI003CCC924F
MRPLDSCLLGGPKIPNLGQLVDLLAPNVTRISFDRNCLLTDVSTNQEDDETMFIPCNVVPFKEAGVIQEVVFKFNVKDDPTWLQRTWGEVHFLTQLPPHPNLLPLDRIVLDDGDVEPRLLGFTARYLPGGNFENTRKLFRLEWLHQLLDVVDFLNLELGVMHQDIAPRNLLVDDKTNKLILFDFDCAAVGEHNGKFYENRHDVKGVKNFSPTPYVQERFDMIMGKADWPPCWPSCWPLDADVSRFRAVLNEWVAKRTSDMEADKKRYHEAAKRRGFKLPARPKAPD